ncbi:MAG TPA: secretion protein HlyD [Kofleriaceae bacterium]|nr:secretion protein HlyD [Kofleriaceae bacterium]
MRKRILRVLIPLALIGAVVAWLFASGRIGQGEPSDRVKLYGNVDIRQVELGFRVSGRIASMKFEEGQEVAAGALLAELDVRSYQDDVTAAQAQVAQQAAALEKLERGPRRQEITQARASMTERKASLENARTSFERAQRLFSADAIPKSSFDDARTALDTAQARVNEASAALRLLEEGTRAEDISAGRAALDMARARLAATQTALSDTRLLAPADGVVLSRVLEPGAIVAPSNVVYVLSLTRPVWVRAYISEPQLGHVRPGMEVRVRSDSAPGAPLRGRIGFISPVAEFTPKSVETAELRTDLVYRVRVIVDEPGDTLRQGMPVTVEVPLSPVVAEAE